MRTNQEQISGDDRIWLVRCQSGSCLRRINSWRVCPRQNYRWQAANSTKLGSPLSSIAARSGDHRTIPFYLHMSRDRLGLSSSSSACRSMTSSTWPRWPTPWSLECLVFTGGIGEHSKEIRRQICNRLRWLGVTMDPSANDQAKPCIGAKNSEVDILIIPTGEETTIARHCSLQNCPGVRRPASPPAPVPRHKPPSPPIAGKSCKRQADLIVTR